LDEEGNLIQEDYGEEEEMDGYDWIKNFGSAMDRKEKVKTSQNDMGKTSFKLKDLRKRTKDMMAKGEI
jgi:succinate dehydrogenase/fumarate reductase flavoprotein subunit